MTNTTRGRVLIADDEPAFLKSTVALLSREGYECKTAASGADAVSSLEKERFDLLIADIHMPGNEELELIREGPLEGVPVLLVTGEPSLETAIESVKLPVAGYLLKPVRRDDLLREVSRLHDLSEMFRSLARGKERLRYWSRDLDSISHLQNATGKSGDRVTEVFMESTVRYIIDSLLDFARLSAPATNRTTPDVELCRLLKCPRLRHFVAAIDETIDVLEKTKRSFRSKELGELRAKLVALRRSQTW